MTMVLEKTQTNGWQRPFTGRPRAFQHALLAGYVAGLRDFVNGLSEAGMAKIWDWVAAKDKGVEDAAAARLYRHGNWGDVEEEDGAAPRAPVSPSRPRRCLCSRFPFVSRPASTRSLEHLVLRLLGSALASITSVSSNENREKHLCRGS